MGPSWLRGVSRTLRAIVAAGVRPWKALVTLALVLLLWQVWTSVGSVPSYLLPSPRGILAYMVGNPGNLLSNAAVTLREVAIAFTISLLGGVALAVVIDRSRFLAETLLPIFVTTQVIPTIAIAPLLVLWLGFGDPPKIAVAVMVSFFPIVINTLAGLRAVDEDLRNLATSLCASNWQRLRLIQFPTALPHIFAGARVAITLATIGAVVGEFVGADQGLGFLVLTSSARLQSEAQFAAIFLLAVIGVGLFNVVRYAEKLIVPWEREISRA
jgi:NitT/TauT family transport system permease protein